MIFLMAAFFTFDGPIKCRATSFGTYDVTREWSSFQTTICTVFTYVPNRRN
jgi:hypothetical protein